MPTKSTTTNAPIKSPTKSITTTNMPTIKPTKRPTYKRPTYAPIKEEECLYKTEEYEPQPPYEYHLCDNIMETEWRFDLIKWHYNDKKDTTDFIYSLCTLNTIPYNYCGGNKNETISPSPIDKLILQLPCECEICMNYPIKDMTPLGYTNQIGKLFMWSDLNIKKNECIKIQLSFHGYVNAKNGNFFIEGINRYTKSNIQIPFPCDDLQLPNIPKIPLNDNKITPSPTTLTLTPTTDEISASKILYKNKEKKTGNFIDDEHVYNSNELAVYFPKDSCKFYCEINEMEYQLKFMNKIYNELKDETQFIYQITVNDKEPKTYCSFENYLQSLNYFYLSLPNNCIPQSKTFLNNITINMKPINGFINKLKFQWKNENILPGESKNYTILLKGNIGIKIGSYTIGGNNRCGGNEILVPNPCNDRCLYGQWTKWKIDENQICSQKCYGGRIKKSRKCYSVCDGKTPIDNCFGESHHYHPCNTQPCKDPRYDFDITEKDTLLWQG